MSPSATPVSLVPRHYPFLVQDSEAKLISLLYNYFSLGQFELGRALLPLLYRLHPSKTEAILHNLLETYGFPCHWYIFFLFSYHSIFMSLFIVHIILFNLIYFILIFLFSFSLIPFSFSFYFFFIIAYFLFDFFKLISTELPYFIIRLSSANISSSAHFAWLCAIEYFHIQQKFNVTWVFIPISIHATF